MRDALPTLLRCVACFNEWELDFEPSACTCDDGGFFQISVDGEVWTDQFDGSGGSTWRARIDGSSESVRGLRSES